MSHGINILISTEKQRFLARLLGVLIICLAVGGCSTDDIFGSEQVPEPIGIGRDRNNLKRSPCACIELPQDYTDWMKG